MEEFEDFLEATKPIDQVVKNEIKIYSGTCVVCGEILTKKNIRPVVRVLFNTRIIAGVCSRECMKCCEDHTLLNLLPKRNNANVLT